MEKINVILDTDISNEIDDQFALAYLIKSIEPYNLEAITIAPFSNSHFINTSSIEEGTNISFEVARKILDLLNAKEYKNVIYKGASKYFFESKNDNPATTKIIEIAKKNNHTTILAIGAITNVALALYKAPEIAEKLDIIWLGGHSFMKEKNNEYNFRQDVEAVREVFNSKANVTVIPCANVASQLKTTIYELQHYLTCCGEIGNYLCDIFKNCKNTIRENKLESIGESKTLWDISTVAYLNNKDWFTTKQINLPEILDDTSYKFTENKKQINFIMDLKRDKIFNDFFLKMGFNLNNIKK